MRVGVGCREREAAPVGVRRGDCVVEGEGLLLVLG